jgi:hypothetical protein
MYTVAEVVGHQKGDLGLSMTSRYAGRETMAARASLREGGDGQTLYAVAGLVGQAKGDRRLGALSSLLRPFSFLRDGVHRTLLVFNDDALQKVAMLFLEMSKGLSIIDAMLQLFLDELKASVILFDDLTS